MSPKTILAVDDSPENLDLLVGLLKKEYCVKAAVNGEIALKIATSSPHPDLILLDIVMPGMDGLEVCRRLKDDKNTAHIPIVFLSGKANSEESEQGMEYGGEGFLKKPVDPNNLFPLLEILLM